MTQENKTKNKEIIQNPAVTINKKEDKTAAKGNIPQEIHSLKETLKKMDELRDHEKLLKMVDYVDFQVNETKEINQEYEKVLDKDPDNFNTVYLALTLLSKNSDITSDKIEILEKFINEIDSKTAILKSVQIKTLDLIQKSLSSIIKKINSR